MGMLASAGIGILVLAVVLGKPGVPEVYGLFSSLLHEYACSRNRWADGGGHASPGRKFWLECNVQHRTQNRSGCVGAVRENGLKNKHGFGNAPLYIPLPDRGWACDPRSDHNFCSSWSFRDVSTKYDRPCGQCTVVDHPLEGPGKDPPEMCSFNHEPVESC